MRRNTKLCLTLHVQELTTALLAKSYETSNMAVKCKIIVHVFNEVTWAVADTNH